MDVMHDGSNNDLQLQAQPHQGSCSSECSLLPVAEVSPLPTTSTHNTSQVFEPFGQVELVQLPLDPLTGLCKGFGFVQFVRLEDAKAAQSLNGQLEIAGRVIKVSVVTDQTGVQVSGATGDLDDDDGGGLALNASSRALLMQKLDRSGITTSLTGGMGTAGLSTPVVIPTVSVLGAAPAAAPLLHHTVPGLGSIPGATLPITIPSIDLAPPSECLLLKNMFDPALEDHFSVLHNTIDML
ncbi:unnamed protein product [Miscanthus lutarioriparius]|uniref:RRM domain-containing protein n=1 Tax=Miscanthus lutarioriparius TaxID=422564 RepID=A0A811QCW6_9POAL|nr:unnamed protein product [Miscanthus lutarioriparius]